MATAAGHLSDRGRIGGLLGSDSDSELESSQGGLGGLETAEMNFLSALEIPLSEKGSSWWLGCSVSALVKGILMVSSSNKAASLPCPVTVEIGGMSLSSPPNLGTLTHRGAGSSKTEALHPVTLVGVRSSGKSSSNLGPLGKYGETVLRNPSTSCW
jgi:hypothetical protein